jgi:hypothetical protein
VKRDDLFLVVCTPTLAGVKPPVPGTTESSCAACGVAVWLAPSTARRIERERAAGVTVRIECFTCADKPAAGVDALTLDLDEEQLREIRAALEPGGEG